MIVKLSKCLLSGTNLSVQRLKETSAVEADQPGGTAGGRDNDLVTAVKIYVIAPVKRAFGAQLAAAPRGDHFNSNAVVGR